MHPYKMQNFHESSTWDIILIRQELLHQLSITRLFEKANLRHVPVTGSHTRKGDMSVMSIQVTPFCCPMLRKFAQ